MCVCVYVCVYYFFCVWTSTHVSFDPYPSTNLPGFFEPPIPFPRPCDGCHNWMTPKLTNQVESV